MRRNREEFHRGQIKIVAELCKSSKKKEIISHFHKPRKKGLSRFNFRTLTGVPPR